MTKKRDWQSALTRLSFWLLFPAVGFSAYVVSEDDWQRSSYLWHAIMAVVALFLAFWGSLAFKPKRSL